LCFAFFLFEGKRTFSTQMDLFEDYDKDLLQLFDRVKKRTSNLSSLSGEQKIAEQEEIKEIFKEAEELIQYLKIEVKKPSSSASERQGRLRERESELENWKKTLKKVSAGFGSVGDRENLLSGNKLEGISAFDQRTRLLHDTEKLDEGTETIRGARRVAEEAVQIGIGVLGSLDEQNERMRRSKDRVGALNDNLKKARKLLQDMWKTALTNKCLIILLILIILVVIGIVVWVKWFNTESSSPSPTSSPTTPFP